MCPFFRQRKSPLRVAKGMDGWFEALLRLKPERV
jgi:hypothetical protein